MKKINRSILLFAWFSSFALSATTSERPNILWIYAEDTSPWMGCYGDSINAEATPNIDSIAEAGILFKRAFVPAPVCSATRSAMIVGQSGIRFGAHEHRSSRQGTKIHLPEGYKLLPELMKEKGYTTFNHGKTDYNFVYDSKIYNYQAKSKVDFKELVSKQPFFGQIQTKGGKTNTSKFPQKRQVRPEEVQVPLDYPQNQVHKEIVAQHYNAIRMEDDQIGEILKGLKDAELDKNTIVVYFSDHGANNLLRHKQMTTEGGLHVPFLIMGPAPYIPNQKVRNDLVNLLDLTATTLSWAKVSSPSWYEGQDLFGDSFQERKFVAAHKDRLDHTIDQVRTVRTDQYRYVRNYKLDRIFLQPQYRDKKVSFKNLVELYRNGELSSDLKKIYFDERAPEELYKVDQDPSMVNNLIYDRNFSKVLEEHRKLLNDWIQKGDLGKGEETIKTLQANGENRPWGEGVNVEYETYRKDLDGDGLSDKWEQLNQRDPKDGLLLFEFDCGGWQTEGWYSENILSNLAGSLGYLDFTLNGGKGSIIREGLNLQLNPKDSAILLKLKSQNSLKINLYANGKRISSAKSLDIDGFQTIAIPLKNKNWKGTLQSLEVQFSGSDFSFIEIDFIRLERIDSI